MDAQDAQGNSALAGQTALEYAQQVRATGGAEELRALLSGSARKRSYGGKKLIPREG